jgi:hypothetical protein
LSLAAFHLHPRYACRMTSIIIHDCHVGSTSKRLLELAGTFVVRSNQLVISDIVDDDHIDNVRSGNWHAFVERVPTETSGDRIAALVVIHERVIGNPIAVESVEIPWQHSGLVKTVDSGSVSIFDADQFVYADADQPELDVFRDWWSNATEENGVGVGNGGVVSNAGLGDGGYRVDVARGPSGWVIAVQIDFASDTTNQWAAQFAEDVARRRAAST